MKRLIIFSIVGIVAFAACSQSVEAQMFRRWRRNNNNGYNNGYYNTGRGNGYYGTPPAAVPSYRTGGYQPGVAAPTTPTMAAPTLAPRGPVVAPGATMAVPRNAVPGVVGSTPRGPIVGPVPYVPGDPRILGDGTNAARRAESAILGAGVRPAGSKVNEGTTVIDQP